ncbi:MAG: hypothetical protein ABI761_06620 [Saprospiraceae bacterium]
MIAICDSGASKGDWAFIKDTGIVFLESSGFNPYTHDHSSYREELIRTIDPEISQGILRVYFYGAGCAEPGQKLKVKTLLENVFPNSNFSVDTDLLAAAKATCGNNKGIACILGTGSNSGLYDGHTFIDSVPNLGYLLGDEGGGNYFGKLLIRSYFFRDMPDNLKPAFEEFAGSQEKIMKKLYSKDEAVNTYLAGFMRFAMEHKEDLFIQHLITKDFQDLINANLSKYEGHKIIPTHFVGSVAYYYQDLLRACLSKNGIPCGTILAKPLNNLVEYHRSHG